MTASLIYLSDHLVTSIIFAAKSTELFSAKSDTRDTWMSWTVHSYCPYTIKSPNLLLAVDLINRSPTGT